MAGNLTIRQAQLVLPDRVVTGDLVIEDGVITEVGAQVTRPAGEQIDGHGLTVLPGVIDGHVHFRDPDDNPAEDIASGSRAAAAGGVTSFLDMANTRPACTTLEQLETKLAIAADRSAIHFGFFLGATGQNMAQLNATVRTPGIQLSLGAMGRGLDMERTEDIEALFAEANKLIVVNAEDERRLRERQNLYADSDNCADHALIHDTESAQLATQRAIDLAQKYGRRLHILQVSAAEEVALLRQANNPLISAEVSPHHLLLHAETAYDALEARALCNPPIRKKRHAEAMWEALADGTITGVASGHAPHTLASKSQVYPSSPAGLPGVEYTLPLMLQQVHDGHITLRQVARWLSEAPAQTYGIPRKGRLETGYDGDITVVDLAQSRTVRRDLVRSQCGWSPWEGRTLTGWPVLTAVLGVPVYRGGEVVPGIRGTELTFRRTSN